MEHIFLSSSELGKIKSISVDHPYVCRHSICDEVYILKFLGGSNDYNKAIYYTVEELNRNKAILPVEFCIPDFWIDTDYGTSAFALPNIPDSLGLDKILNSEDIPHREKIEFLKKVGALLRKCDEVRKVRHMSNFAICDLHEGNVLVNPTKKEIKIVDMDTCKIGKGFSFEAKYMTPQSLAMQFPKKYSRVKKFGYIEATPQSDLYCYTIMIMNYIAKYNMSTIDVESFCNYIDYLNYIGVNHELLDIFYNIISRKPNVNPDYLLDSISEDILFKSRYNR